MIIIGCTEKVQMVCWPHTFIEAMGYFYLSTWIYCADFATQCKWDYFQIVAEPESSSVHAYWEDDRLMAAAIKTVNDTFILEVYSLFFFACFLSAFSFQPRTYQSI